MAVFDADLRLVRANAGMEQVLSLTEDQMRGLRLPEIVPHPVSDETEAKMRRVLEGGGPQQLRAGAGPAGTGANDGWSTSWSRLEDPAGHVRAVCLAAHQRLQEHLARRRSAERGLVPHRHHRGQQQHRAGTGRHRRPWARGLRRRRSAGRPARRRALPAAPARPLAATRTAVSVLDDGPPPFRRGHGGHEDPLPGPVTGGPVPGPGPRRPVDAADPDLLRWARQDPEAAQLLGSTTHSVMVVPMRAHGATLGVALFGRHRHAEPFETDDLWLAEELTAKAAVSIHTARRGSREHTSTMTLQRSLLPQTLPDQGALDIATRYLPAGTRAGVGGDWFDVIPLSGARVALSVVRRRGRPRHPRLRHHGPAGTAVRTLADVDLPPDELLTHLDDLVLHLSADESGTDDTAESAGGIGAACLYAVYDPVSRRCALAGPATRRPPRSPRTAPSASSTSGRPAAGPGRPAVRDLRDRTARGQPPGPLHRRCFSPPATTTSTRHWTRCSPPSPAPRRPSTRSATESSPPC